MRMRKGMDDVQRLNVLLARTEHVDDCMLWVGCRNTDGYPKVYWKGNFNAKGHRVVYQLCHPDENMDGKVVRHTCNTPLCINPNHLLSGTSSDNMADRDAQHRHGATKLTRDQVLEIDELFRNKTDLKVKEIAQLYDVNFRTISSIKHKKHWKHLLL